MLEIASKYMGILDHVPEVDKDLKEDQILKDYSSNTSTMVAKSFSNMTPLGTGSDE